MIETGSDLGRMLGGRQRYNRFRQDLASLRRQRLVELLRSIDISERGWRSHLARELGVDPATISRDLKTLAKAHREHAREKVEIWERADEARATSESRLQLSMARQLRRSTGCPDPLAEILLGSQARPTADEAPRAPKQ